MCYQEMHCRNYMWMPAPAVDSKRRSKLMAYPKSMPPKAAAPAVEYTTQLYISFGVFLEFCWRASMTKL